MQDHEALDRILHAISQAPPPPGMDHRLLQALDTQATLSRPAWFGSEAAWSLAAALLLTAVLIPIYRRPAVHNAPNLTSALNRPSTENTLKPTPVNQPATHHLISRRSRKPSAVTVVLKSPDSYPAPPMPLTEQEKLLLLVVRRADPEQLAMLDPDLRLQRESADQADFNAFFQPPAPAAEEPIPLLPTGETL